MGAFVPLIIVLLAAGVLWVVVVVYLMARALLRPPRMTDGKALYVLHRLTPRDVGLRFEPMTFQVRDEIHGRSLKLAAWWIPAATRSDKTVVLVHGYADAKVGALAWAPLWHDLSFHILAVDLRAHGDSEGSVCTGGYAERYDLEQVVHELVARRTAETGILFLFGVSLGGAVAAGAADLMRSTADRPRATDSVSSPSGSPPSPDRRLPDAVVLESCFADFRSASLAHFDRLGLPNGWIAALALRYAQWASGANFAAVRPADLLARLDCPLLVLAAGDDLYVSPVEAAAMGDAVAHRPDEAGPSVYRTFANAEHLMSVIVDPQGYRREIAAFVAGVLDRRTSGAGRGMTAQTDRVAAKSD